VSTVAIVGSQKDTRHLAPWDDMTKDIWVFNEAANQAWCKRADVVFQMHHPGVYRSPLNRADPEHWKWLQDQQGRIIYMQEEDPSVLSSSRYPLDAICEDLLTNLRFGRLEERKRYFTSTVAYALALAIWLGIYDRIEIYGVEMASNTEYEYQRQCVLFWVGVGIGRGIEIVFVSGESIFDAPLYGYEGNLESDPAEFERRAADLRAGVAITLERKAELEKQLRAGANNGNLAGLISDMVNAWGELGNLEGRQHENDRYAYKLRKMIDEGLLPYIDRSEYEGACSMQMPLVHGRNEELLKTTGKIDYLMRGWMVDHNPTALHQIKEFTEQLCRTSYAAGRAQGIYDENANFISRWDKTIRAAGGQRAAEMMEG
jgi:hypothetical protein